MSFALSQTLVIPALPEIGREVGAEPLGAVGGVLAIGAALLIPTRKMDERVRLSAYSGRPSASEPST